MADPAIVACTAGAWTKIATNVTGGTVHLLTGVSQPWLQTYRDTGGAAPTLRSEGIEFGKDSLSGETEAISASAGIDVYLWPDDSNGTVRVDL